MLYHKGHKFYGPDGQGYELTVDVEKGAPVQASHFRPFGGAPVPEPKGAYGIDDIGALQCYGPWG